MSFNLTIDLYPKTTIFLPSENVMGQVQEKLFNMKKNEIEEHASYKQFQFGMITNSKDVFNGISSKFKTVDGEEYYVNFETGYIEVLRNKVQVKIVSRETVNNRQIVKIRGVLFSQDTVDRIKGKPVQKKPSSTKKGNSNCEQYWTSWNGFQNGYWVCIKPNGFTLVYCKGKKVLTTTTKQVLIGKSPECPMTDFSGGAGSEWDGNAILLRVTGLDYVFIGEKVYKFTAEKEITEFVSPVGNNSVPYTYGSDGENVYLFIEDKMMKMNSELRKGLKDCDPYEYYYNNNSSAKDLKNYSLINDTCV